MTARSELLDVLNQFAERLSEIPQKYSASSGGVDDNTVSQEAKLRVIDLIEMAQHLVVMLEEPTRQ